MTTPRCLVMAHGRGTRLRSRTQGACKGLLRLDDRTTILTNLLDACVAQGLDPILTVRPEDRRLAEFATGRRWVQAEPTGYIVDLASLSAGADDVIVLECDTVAAPSALRAALAALLASPSDCTLAVAARPRSDDPRAIRPLVGGGRMTGLADDPDVPRTTGIYRFTGTALTDIREFADGRLGTFHDFMAASVGQARPMALHVMDTAFNVNSPTEFEAAHQWWNTVRAGANSADFETQPTN